jgi:hypothetical protein
MSPVPVYGARRDNSEPGVVKAFRAGGASVDFLPGGNGRPDLLIGFLRETHLVETKTDGAGLRASQKEWAAKWLGSPVVVARTPAQARKWLAIWRERHPTAEGGGGTWAAVEDGERLERERSRTDPDLPGSADQPKGDA